ncbi:MAG: hypothetical protein ACREBG_15380 [Pyrinomonadaceae bacterium]
MATQTQTATGQEPTLTVEKTIQQVRELYTDAPALGKTALENFFRRLMSEGSEPRPPMESAGRVGSRQGKVSELTVIAPFAPGGAQRLRALMRLLNGSFDAADKVGTVQNIRFVFLDNDTKLLFATAYEGDWDPYIDDFATKIPDDLDVAFCNLEGWPGIHSPSVKDYIVKHQLTAEGWYVATPDLAIAEARRLQRVGKAVDEFLDKVQ